MSVMFENLALPGGDEGKIASNPEAIDELPIDAIFEEVLALDHIIRANLGPNLLSHEFRLIAQLCARKSLIVKEASLSSLLSGRAFYELLKRLERDGVLSFEPNQDDRRSKSIKLNEAFAGRLIDQFRGLLYGRQASLQSPKSQANAATLSGN